MRVMRFRIGAKPQVAQLASVGLRLPCSTRPRKPFWAMRPHIESPPARRFLDNPCNLGQDQATAMFFKPPPPLQHRLSCPILPCPRIRPCISDNHPLLLAPIPPVIFRFLEEASRRGTSSCKHEANIGRLLPWQCQPQPPSMISHLPV